MSDSSQGQIVTFYSYKGGTGRTMAHGQRRLDHRQQWETGPDR